jgi:hypothetical protein
MSCPASESTAAVSALWRPDTNVIGIGPCETSEPAGFFFRYRFVPFFAPVDELSVIDRYGGRFAFGRLPVLPSARGSRISDVLIGGAIGQSSAAPRLAALAPGRLGRVARKI